MYSNIYMYINIYILYMYNYTSPNLYTWQSIWNRGSSGKLWNFHLLLCGQQINKQILSLRGVSQEGDLCFSEMLRDCGSPGSRSTERGTAHRMCPWVGGRRGEGEPCQLVTKKKEGAMCSLIVSKRTSSSSNDGLEKETQGERESW